MANELFQLGKLLVKRKELLVPQKSIILLSHMRANTSLIGHILGSHPEINGYYEMHIGYYSWKSKLRQKLHFFREHDVPRATYIFDKVLHNEHEVTSKFLLRDDVIPLFCIREPLASVQSTVKLFQKSQPNHEYCNITRAADYYMTRCQKLRELYLAVQHKSLFYRAEQLISDSNSTLVNLSKFIQLSSYLQPEFKQHKLTGVGTTGDLSGNLASGKIEQRNNPISIDLDDALQQRLLDDYQQSLALFEH